MLATIHGEQNGDEIDDELAAKNRQVWNAWSCQNLSEERCTELAEAMGLEVSDLQACPETERHVTSRFGKRPGEDALWSIYES